MVLPLLFIDNGFMANFYTQINVIYGINFEDYHHVKMNGYNLDTLMMTLIL